MNREYFAVHFIRFCFIIDNKPFLTAKYGELGLKINVLAQMRRVDRRRR